MTDWASPDTAPEQPAPVPPVDGLHSEPPTRTLPPTPVPLGPMTIPDILDGAFNALKRRPRDVLASAAIVVIATQLVLGWLFRDELNVQLNVIADSFSADAADANTDFASTSLVFNRLFDSLRLLVVASVMTPMIVGWFQGVLVTPATAAKHALRRSPVLLLTWLIVHLLEAVGLLALGIGSVVVMVYSQVATAIVMVEPVGPIAAIKRSWALTRARSGAAFSVPIYVVIIQLVASSGLQAVTELAVAFTPDQWRWLTRSAGAIGVDLIFVPVTSAAMILLYLDLRVRREGIDIGSRVGRTFADG